MNQNRSVNKIKTIRKLFTGIDGDAQSLTIINIFIRIFLFTSASDRDSRLLTANTAMAYSQRKQLDNSLEFTGAASDNI